jgi:uncharacterized integral membrane protein (TIGR00698 family)
MRFRIPTTYRQIIFFVVLVLCFANWMSAPLALFAGIVMAFTVGHPFLHLRHLAPKILLQIAVVGLGFGMNVHSAVAAGQQGVLFTLCSVTAVMLAGLLLGRAFGLDRNIRVLVSAGTAICGGSAIAAISPAIRAGESQISVSLATVFILNAVALVLFPQIGHGLGLDEHTFGMWAAVAIHDTSSVAGAGQVYGPQALETALTVKLIRTLWLIPLIFVIAFTRRQGARKMTLPWFVFGFAATMCINTYVPQAAPVTSTLAAIAKKLLIVTLFLIGAGLSGKNLKQVGFRPLLFGIVLWALTASVSLTVIRLLGSGG